MKTVAMRRVVLLGLCVLFAVGGFLAAQFLPAANAQAASSGAMVGAVSGSIGQVHGTEGPYTVVPIMDSGAGYTWMAYAMAFAPDGTVTIINTHPKKTDQLGTVFKKFSIK